MEDSTYVFEMEGTAEEVISNAVYKLIGALETGDHEFEAGEEVGQLTCGGYKVVIYIDKELQS